MAARWGLRGKSAATLLLACLLSLIPAAIIGWQAIDDIRRHFANAYAENYTLLHMQKILAPVSRELALARRLADSVVTRQWLEDETDRDKRARFFEEAEGFRHAFADRSYFVITDAGGDYYFSDDDQPDQRRPRYRLDAEDPDDAWYFGTIASDEPYNLNVNIDRKLGVTKVWFNVVVRNGQGPLGLAGTGLDLSDFLDAFVRDEAPGLTPLIVDRQGALQAHPSLERIAFSSGAGDGDIDERQTVHSLLGDAEQQQRLTDAMQASRQSPERVETLWATLEGRERLLSVGYIPEIDWHLITALDLGVAPILERRWLWSLFIALTLVLGILLMAFAYAIDRLILTPLNRLKLSAQAIADGHYDSRLPTSRNDEIGELSQAFSRMADQVERHTQELEGKVRERTRALEQANAEMAAAHQQIGDSLQYASIIQRAILPDRQLDLHLEHAHGVLWKPRDTVGGDFYVFRATDRGYLMGVVDCAGHGVPGSLMTMLARAIIDHAILQVGPEDPAAILIETDRQNRDTLRPDQLPASIATNMDIGLVWVDLQARRLTFSGAKIGLYATDGATLERLPGHRQALGHRRPVTYQNQSAPLHLDWTYSLCTDGFLDQAGGDDGFGFGTRRFEAMLKAQARRPIDEQMVAFETELRAYQGSLPQRDDITLLGFRFTRDTEVRQRNREHDTHREPPTDSPAGTGQPQ
ncbi:biofilm regulation protein phosphatase SiaA [Halomonas sp. EGI 63088]|uniref:Biofilm regulation protein phosphatase SiaA n=1 Tax=Halomonas flagellata TaxID=2920385 RepID=A0ABS9RS18_9GAMM|nr:biofilm regulation protein phosphatase SiaA [Halomonas flagellata]MCH4562629.1 biofilm regulation protein phosphatase SiaA [Halomonas flagellata]